MALKTWEINWRKWGSVLIGLIVLATTFAWAFAFTRIYTEPHTRVAATRWIFQHEPGPVTLEIQTESGKYYQPIPVPDSVVIRKDEPFVRAFDAKEDGLVTTIELPHVFDLRTSQENGGVVIDVSLTPEGDDIVTTGFLTTTAIVEQEKQEDGVWIPFEPVVNLEKDRIYYLQVTPSGNVNAVEFCGPLSLSIQTPSESQNLEIPSPPDCFINETLPHRASFSVSEDSILTGLYVGSVRVLQRYQPEEQVLQISFEETNRQENRAVGIIESKFLREEGDSYTVQLDEPLELVKGQQFQVSVTLLDGGGSLGLTGKLIANETSWDDGLPLRMDGYDPFGGIYKGGLNFEMYWDDNQEKYQRFVDILDSTDIIVISSSRQWASTTRLPERYPLTTAYYRHLAGCPAGQSVELCFNQLQAGQDHGDLGFRLVKVFQSNPKLGSLEINDQFAEEAFTVYDHPKVFIFEKNENYDPEYVRQVLGSVDLSQVVHVTPRQASTNPANLLLPPERLMKQYAGGTWSELFNTNAIYNKIEFLGVVLWYLVLFLLGLSTYPIARYAFSGLNDYAYPFTRIFGLLLLSWLSWMGGSIGFAFSRMTIGLAFAVIIVVGGLLAYIQRKNLIEDWKANKKYFLTIEILFLAFFVAGLLIRYGNPDLWHPWKGGEKPMDFSYFNAVLKSTTFPPYDPWFAKGYINYYYYGFVLVGVLVKLLGIVPSFAYNLIIPTLLAMTALGAFSIVWNLVSNGKDKNGKEIRSFADKRVIGGIAGAFLMAILGNLGIWQMLYRGFQILGAPVGEMDKVGFVKKVYFAIIGAFKAIAGNPLPYRMDEWYWNPSRVIGAAHGNPITEFPFFTFLYADLHAHMIAMPIAMLAIAWGLSVVQGRVWGKDGRRSIKQVLFGLFAGGLVIGVTYPVNLSDSYTYVLFGVVVLGYAIYRYWDVTEWKILPMLPLWAKRVLNSLWGVLLFVAFAKLLYRPYSYWYAQGYSKVNLWIGSHTPISDYLTHWGLFLFIIVSWLFYETIDWMAKTPVSSLRKLQPYKEVIVFAIAFLVVLTLVLGVNLKEIYAIGENLPIGLGVATAWLIVPLAGWVGALLLRKDNSDGKRFVLFLVGTALMLTLLVEIVTVQGDIGRMNTVFKFYLQAWAMLSVSAAAALYWLLGAINKKTSGWYMAWLVGLMCLLGIASMYPLIGTMAKVRDRMAPSAPHTLDGMKYMQFATYYDLDTEMKLDQDYNAIRWLQENIKGSPVIVEANMVEYHWGTRYTIYTGLPGVIGWNWHQRQQRATTPQEWVFNRIEEVNNFYQTTDVHQAAQFLRKYDVQYIILGQLERAKYAGDGLKKFDEQEGVLWQEVYREGDTAIYQTYPLQRAGE